MVVIDTGSLEWEHCERGETAFRRKQPSAAAAEGDPDLGCSLYELPARAKSWPYHYHEDNAEAMYVLAGEGQVRIDGDVHRIREGSYVHFPASEAGAHRVINDSGDPLRYLAMSTMREPDVTVYPDSGKIGVFAGAPPGGREERSVSGYYRQDDETDYRDGED